MTAILRRLTADRGRMLVAVAIVATVVIYLPTLGRGLVNLDDTWLVRDNWIVRDPSWSSVHTIFFDLDLTHRFALTPEYLPIRDLSVMADYALWGTWFGGHHLTNLLLYVLAIPLWFAVLTGFGIDRKLAGLALLLWALHPSHAESVAWLSERKGVLGMMFAGACGLAYVRFRAGGSPRWLALAATCAVCAVWSKALAAFALAGLGGLELVLPAGRIAWRRSLVGLGTIATFAGLAFVPVMALATSSSVIGTAMRAPAGRIEMALGTFGFYLRLGVLAIRDAVAYPISTDGPTGIDLALGIAGLAASIAVIVWRGPAWRAPVRAGAMIWLVGWFPISHLVLPLQMVFVADRYLLFPTLGLAVVIAALVSRVPRAHFGTALAAVVVLASAARTLDAELTWRDSQTLWARAVASNPADGDAWSMYAESLADAGDRDGAAEAVARGLEHTHAPRLLLREALIALADGDVARGRVLMQQAAEAGEPRAMTNLAELWFEDGKLDDALAWARRSNTIAPLYANGYRITGKLALAAHTNAEALAAFTRALELEPNSMTNRYNLALALIALDRPAEARAYLEACTVDPVVGVRARALLGTLHAP